MVGMPIEADHDMIVKSNKTSLLIQSLHRSAVIVVKPTGFDNFTSTAEVSKVVVEKCMINLSEAGSGSYHQNAKHACACAYIELIKIVKYLDSEATIICAGLKCDVPGWEKSLADLIPCDGIKADKLASQMEKLTKYSKTYSGTSGLAKTLSSLKVPKPPKPTELVNFPGEYPEVPGELEVIPIAGKNSLVRSVHGAVYNF